MLRICGGDQPQRIMSTPTSKAHGVKTDTVFDNVGLVAAVIALLVAQGLKPFTAWAGTRKFRPSLAVSSGGFPSSHTALVVALATGVCFQKGVADPAFACCVVLALVVMYDAMGVRRQAGMFFIF